MKILIIIICAVAAAAVFFIVTARINSTPLTEDEAADRIQSLLEKQLQKTASGTGAVIMVKSAEYSIDRVFTAGTAAGKPVTADQPFHVASVGKAFTAVLTGMLVDEGKIGLDDPVADYLPPEVLDGLFTYKDADYSKTVTLRHLLGHTSGAADYFEDRAEGSETIKKLIISDPGRFWTPAELVDFTRKYQKAVGAPGEKYHYSDTGYILLGLMLESVTGESFHEMLHRRIFGPLGMDDSYLMFYSEPVNPKRPILDIYVDGENVTDLESLSIDWAGGGIVSTAGDLEKFLRALAGGRLLSTTTLEDFYGFDNSFIRGIHYGLGFMEYRFSEFAPMLGSMPRMRGHMGVLGTQMFYDPEGDTVYISGFGSTDYSSGSVRTMISILSTAIRIK